MYMREENAGQRLQIRSYGNGGFKVGEDIVAGSMMIMAGFADAVALLNMADLTPKILEGFCNKAIEWGEGVEVLLLGGGMNLVPITPQCQKWLRENKIAFDMMDTGAAARTYNLLQSENRRVGAILVAVD